MVSRRPIFHLAKPLGMGVWEKRVPHLHSGFSKLLAAQEFEQPVEISAEEANAIIQFVHDYIRANQKY